MRKVKLGGLGSQLASIDLVKVQLTSPRHTGNGGTAAKAGFVRTARSESIGVLWTKEAMSLISGSYSRGLTVSTGPFADIILLIEEKAVVLTAVALNAGPETLVEMRGAVKRATEGRAARRVRLSADIGLLQLRGQVKIGMRIQKRRRRRGRRR